MNDLQRIDLEIAQLHENLKTSAINRAVCLGEAGRSDEAMTQIEHVIRSFPEDHTARLNYATLLMQVQRFEEAIAQYNTVLKVDTEFNDLARFGRGFSNLVLGNLREGFIDFESRKKLDLPPGLPSEWDGVSSLDGKRLLVIGEMGFGDNIMFLRYCRELHDRGAKITVCIPPAMIPLAECLEPKVNVMTEKSHANFDYYVRMMSLAYCLDTDIDCVPPPAQFNLPEAQLIRWSKALPQTRLKIGLCWSGSRDSQYDKFRNIPLRELTPLFSRNDIDFYSLVLDVRDDDKQAFNELPIYDVGAKIKHFRDTASFISNLDLVITVDTSIAHLAGSLGVLTWVMLTSFRTYWLWIRDRTDCPWYPSAKAFRQPTDGDWSSVVKSINAELGLMSPLSSTKEKERHSVS